MSRLDPDLEHDNWVERVDAGELCPECSAVDIKRTTSGPIFRIPMFECRLCGHCFFDSFTKPTPDAWTLPLFKEAA